ncbi:MAG: AAA family ATPase [Deltaproteobacteria bacterium]|nr:AAA family ATPase [Deltaproteobacteria bacterium]
MATETLTFPPFILDPSNACLWRGRKHILLTPKDFAVLHYLVTHSGGLVTQAEVLKGVWPDTVVDPGILKVRLRRIRLALGDKVVKPRFIETVHGRGYRFIAPVTTAPSVASGQEERGQTQKAKGQEQKAKIALQRPVPSTQRPVPIVVGREAELGQLHNWLEKALQGERQIVFVTGEPGIGKTTVVEAFLAQVAAAGGAWIGRGQGIEQHGIGEAYMPVLEALGRLCRAPEGEHFRALLSQHAPTWLAQLPRLLSATDLEALQRRVLGATRERMLREMAEAIEVFTAEHTLVLWLEDLHWMDTSTLALLSVLARRRERARLLVIGTYRPVEVVGQRHPLHSLTQELGAHDQATELALGLLSEANVAAYLDARCPASVLPTRLARVLHQRTGGNPLFLVSLVHDWVNREVLVHADGSWTLQGDLEALTMEVPDGIRQLVARQRERLLPTEQRVLAAASIAGREFSAAAVAAALATDVVEVEEQCAGLAERQQFLRPAGITEWPDGTLAARHGFLHALYQQLWHERVSVGRQRQWHLRIGERKEAAYGNRANEIAAELAVHFEQGRDYRRAIRYLQQAGENAIRRSANAEAIDHLSKAVELLTTLPDTPERAQQELGLQIALSVPLVMSKGYTAPAVERACARARDLCQQIGETPQLFQAVFGLFRFYDVRGELYTARELGEQLIRLAQRGHDHTLLLVAHAALGAALFQIGDLAAARAQAEHGLALYDPQRHGSLIFSYGDDLGLVCRSSIAWILQMCGYPDQAQARNQEVLALARELSYPFILLGAFWTAGFFHQLRREGQRVQEMAEAAVVLGNEQGFVPHAASGAILRGWALAEQGQGEEGIAGICQGLETLRAMGALLWRPYALGLLAEAYGKEGQAEEGLTVLAEALVTAERTGQRWHEAELYRLKGELSLQSRQVEDQSKTSQDKSEAEAEACFWKAIEIARRQQAKSLELRAVMGLSRLWQRQGKKAEARRMLAEVYGWFTEGFDTVDLQEAKALLKELS